MGWNPPERREHGEVPIEDIRTSPIMGVSENSTASNLANGKCPNCAYIWKISDNNSLDFPDSFSILA